MNELQRTLLARLTSRDGQPAARAPPSRSVAPRPGQSPTRWRRRKASTWAGRAIGSGTLPTRLAHGRKPSSKAAPARRRRRSASESSTWATAWACSGRSARRIRARAVTVPPMTSGGTSAPPLAACLSAGPRDGVRTRAICGAGCGPRSPRARSDAPLRASTGFGIAVQAPFFLLLLTQVSMKAMPDPAVLDAARTSTVALERLAGLPRAHVALEIPVQPRERVVEALGVPRRNGRLGHEVCRHVLREEPVTGRDRARASRRDRAGPAGGWSGLPAPPGASAACPSCRRS